jgi:hypothetical protein
LEVWGTAVLNNPGLVASGKFQSANISSRLISRNTCEVLGHRVEKTRFNMVEFFYHSDPIDTNNLKGGDESKMW